MRDTGQQDDDLLGSKFPLVPFGQAQALFVIFDLNLDPTRALIVAIDEDQENGDGISCLGLGSAHQLRTSTSSSVGG